MPSHTRILHCEKPEHLLFDFGVIKQRMIANNWVLNVTLCFTTADNISSETTVVVSLQQL